MSENLTKTQIAVLSDADLERYAREIVGRRGKYRYAYTESRAFAIVLDVLADFRAALSNHKD